MKQLRKSFKNAVTFDVEGCTNELCMHLEIAHGEMDDGRKFRYIVALPTYEPVLQVNDKNGGWTSYSILFGNIINTLKDFAEQNPVTEPEWSATE